MNEIAFLTVVYPGCTDYLDDFFISLKNQTECNFDLVVVNDGLLEFERYKKKISNINIIEINSGSGISKNRELLIKYAIDSGYKYAIFGDIDDCFSENRLEVAVSLLETCDIVVNDLTSFSTSGVISERILSHRLNELDEISLSFILDKNVFGLSNTAINLDGLSNMSVLFDDELVAVDWYFFSCLLLMERKAVFTNSAITYYRQHDSNTVGISTVDAESLVKAIEVKVIHYQSMVQVNELYEPMLCRNKILLKCMDDVAFYEQYIQKNKEQLIHPLWWESIGKED